MAEVKTDYTINVKYQPATGQAKSDFKYIDEGNACADTKRHLQGGKTIKWLLDAPSGYTLQVQFLKGTGSPFISQDFMVAANTKETLLTANQRGSDTYAYWVAVTNTSGATDYDDPKMMFDDGTGVFGGPGRFGIPDPAAIVGTAQEAWQAIFQQLQAAKAKGASGDGIVFYPHGINDIEVTVQVAGVSVNVKIIGPNS